MGLRVIMVVQLKTFSLRSYSFGVGLCDVDKKNLSRFLEFFSILILITILTQTDMLYGYRCILCEFETYFQRKPIRPFPKSCSMSLEQTYGKIHMKSSFPKCDKRQIKKKWVGHAILLCTEPIHCSINVSCQIAIFPCFKCTSLSWPHKEAL